MRRTFRIFLLPFLFCALYLQGVAQEMPFTYFPNGHLEGREVFAFQQNDNKELLFVTPEGVFSFNSRQTVRLFDFDKKQISGIRQALFTSEDLLVLTEEGLDRIDLKKGKLASVSKGPYDRILFEAENELVYLVANGALVRVQNDGKLTQVLEKAGNIRFLESGREELFLVGEKNLRIYTSEWHLKETLPLREPIIDSYYKNGRLLLLTAGAIWSKEENAALKEIASFEQAGAVSILEDQTGEIWVGTKNKGVLLFDGNEYKALDHRNNFLLSGVKGIYESSDLSLWFLGSQGIVYKSFSSPFLKFPIGTVLGGEVVQDMHAIDSGSLAVLSQEGQYHLFKNESFQRVISIPLPFTPDFSRILGDQKTIHLSRKGGLFLYDKGKTFRSSFKNTQISRVFTFNTQTLAVDTKGDVYSFDHQSYKKGKKDWTLMPAKPLLQSGDLLVYTDGQDRIKSWDSRNNTHEVIGDFNLEMIHAGLFMQKYLLFLAKDRQLKYAIGGRQEELDFKIGPNESVASFFITNNDLWISTGDNLYQLMLQVKEGVPVVQDIQAFNFQENNIQLPVLKSIAGGEGNAYWLLSKQSLMLYNSLALVPDITPPGIVLDKVTITGRDSVKNVPFSGQDSIKISLKKGEQLLIKSFAVNYNRKAEAVLSYRFLADGNQWNTPPDQDLILLSGLSAGRHLLELTSINEQGVRSRGRILFIIEVGQEAWYSWWALLGASLSLMMVGFIAYNGIKSVKDSKGKETKERFEKELLKLQKKGHEQMMKAEGLKQINELITAQKIELEDKNKQIVAQKYELSLTNNQIKQQKDLIEKTSDKLQSSINYAQKIQTALMADEIQIKEDLPDSFVFFRARDQVSGDFFWFDKTRNEEGEETLIVGAVDCTGHGVPGAIVSVVGIQLLNAIVKAKGITDPGHILTQLNKDMLESLKYEKTKINDGMDMSLCSIQLNQKRLFFAGAKNPLFIVEDGELEVVKGDKFPIGGQKLREEKSFQTREIALKGNGKQMFYLFSDGYQDQFGGTDNSKFLSRNFKELLIELSDKPMMEQKYMLAKTLSEWQGEESQTDDILVMGFRI